MNTILDSCKVPPSSNLRPHPGGCRSSERSILFIYNASRFFAKTAGCNQL